MPTYASQRPVKAEENLHRPLGTNLIGTLSVLNGVGTWTPGPNENTLHTLSQALMSHHNNGDLPLLWAYTSGGGVTEVTFGYDRMVPHLAVAGAQMKIGHVALTATATISGEIIHHNGHWHLDNNSGAWGSMGNTDGKTVMIHNVANLLTGNDPGGIQVKANRAYSRTQWKRAVQQVFR